MTDRQRDGPQKSLHGASMESSSDTEIAANEIWTITVLIGLALMMQVSINIMIPALPAISGDLHAAPVWEKLTLTAFMIGYGLSPLIIGPLSDRYGRRPVLLCGLAVFVAASVGCTIAPSIESMSGRASSRVSAGDLALSSIVRSLEISMPASSSRG